MQRFLELTGLREEMQIVDLGGTAALWDLLDCDLHVTLVNLPPTNGKVTRPASTRYTNVYADACDLSAVFEDHAFAFSNATIEHVGDESRQEAFAREIRRLAPAYWVQTPSDWFPIGSHCLIPFYWQLPYSARNRLVAHWSRSLPDWSEFTRSTRVLSQRRMAKLFPGAKCYVERLMGLEKSYAFYIPTQAR
jgi:hypothetical protein